MQKKRIAPIVPDPKRVKNSVLPALSENRAGILCAVANAKSRSFLRMFEVKILPKKEKAVAAADELFDRRPEQTRPEVAATVADKERDLS